jgi:hypothetical protein
MGVHRQLVTSLLENKLLTDKESACYWREEDMQQRRYQEGNYSMRTIPMKREVSFLPFNSSLAPFSSPLSLTGRHKQSHHDISSGTGSSQQVPVPVSGSVPLLRHCSCYLTSIRWLFWRVWVVRVRNNSQLISQLVYSGIAPGG